MLARFENVRVLEIGAYDIQGADPDALRWIDVYDPDGREKVIRFGVSRDVPPFQLAFGDMVDLVCDVSNETRVLKGTDRTYVRHNVRIQHVQAAAGAAGKGRAAA
jgi:hypothetical protein